MGKKITIDRWSAGYWFIKNIITKPAHLLYYGKIEINNADRIPDRQPVILAPNHQNALMDAMVLVLHLKYQAIFLTRADVFKKPLIRKMLTYLKMLPVYRIRDGRDNMHKNEEIFETSIQILLNKRNPLCMFPEGNHGEKKRLRPLKKGIFRIAFQAQEKLEYSSGVKIVPIGLDYEDYYTFGKKLFVNIGYPIEVSEYFTAYKKDQEAAIHSLRTRLMEELKKLMIHIETDEYYELYQGLCDIYRPWIMQEDNLKRETPENRFTVDKKITRKLDEVKDNSPGKLDELSELYDHYKGKRDQLRAKNWVFLKPGYSILLNSFKLVLLVILSPLFLAGLLLNSPVFFIPQRYANRLKDNQMKSTISWGFAFGLGLIYYPALFIAGIYILPGTWSKLLFIPFVLFSGLFAYRFRKIWLKTLARIRYTIMIKKSRELKAASDSYKELVMKIKSVFENI